MSAAIAPSVSTWSAWVAAARPATLWAAVSPVLVGTACAYVVGGFSLWPALAALAGSKFIQIGTNFANDVFDHEKGADGPDRLGPVRAVSAGLLSASQVRVAMVLMFALATLCGAYLTWVAGWPVLAIGVLSIASGIAYTGGPFPLGYNGLGDLFVMIFFGFVAVCGTAFVQTGSVPAVAWIASIPVGSLATAIIVVNNVRDREGDAKVGKRTLAVLLGRRVALFEYAGLLAASYLACVWLAVHVASAWPLLPLLTAPIAIRLNGQVRATEGRALNPLLGATAKLLVLHSLLLSAGVVLSRS